MKTALLLALVPAFAACGSDGPPSFTTYDACFDKRPQADEVVDKILECCTNAKIDGDDMACGDSAAACINYLTDNLAQSKRSDVDIMTACDTYEQGLEPADDN